MNAPVDPPLETPSALLRVSERLPLRQAAWVIARRDFVAILFSRAFFFFLLGPLFPLLVGALAGGIGSQVRQSVDEPILAVSLSPEETRALDAARQHLLQDGGFNLPQIATISGVMDDPADVLKSEDRNYGAVLSGTLAAPEMTGSPDKLDRWQGPVAILIAEARQGSPTNFAELATVPIASTTADRNRDQLVTAQSAQLLLFLLSMLLAGMVLSNLVEEKANKIIEILAAAIPMDAVFMGKLFAMLGISLVGIAVWAGAVAAIFAFAGNMLPALTVPAVGWPGFILLGIVYFMMNYLLLGSVFLGIGSLATTVREVQTLSMPITMSQVLIFFLASLAVPQIDSAVGLFAMAFPLSSPYALLALAAQDDALWPHLLGVIWQAVFVVIFIKVGAALFRRRVMKSGPPIKSTRNRWWRKKVA